jgi:RHS repeat-associated protein
VVAFTYDALGRRLTKAAGGTTVRYIYDGLNVIEEYVDNSGWQLDAKYVHGIGIDNVLTIERKSGETWPRWYYHHDGLGSVTELTDASGALSQAYEYDAWGTPTTYVDDHASGNAYMYTGRRWDPEINLYYYRARHYAPHLGRFLQPDPGGYLDGPSLYAYVLNTPTRSTDAMGLCRNDGMVGEGGVGSSGSSSPSGAAVPLAAGSATQPNDPYEAFNKSGVYTETETGIETESPKGLCCCAKGIYPSRIHPAVPMDNKNIHGSAFLLGFAMEYKPKKTAGTQDCRLEWFEYTAEGPTYSQEKLGQWYEKVHQQPSASLSYNAMWSHWEKRPRPPRVKPGEVTTIGIPDQPGLWRWPERSDKRVVYVAVRLWSALSDECQAVCGIVNITFFFTITQELRDNKPVGTAGLEPGIPANIADLPEGFTGPQ